MVLPTVSASVDRTVLDWAQQAAPGDVAAGQHLRIALALYDDRQRKTQQIQALEREIAGRLAQTPYVLLLSFPGINVVSAAQMVAGCQVFRHPCIPGRHDILDKLTAFHRDHDTGMVEVLRDLQAACGQVPPREHAAEARPLQEELQRIQDGRRRGPQVLGDILPLVLARLGGRRGTIHRVRGVDLHRNRLLSRERLSSPRGQP